MNFKFGDFSLLAKEYRHRAGYSHSVLKLLTKHVGAGQRDFIVADVGAGTGKLTEDLYRLGLQIIAVEPNQAMREEGVEATDGLQVDWRAGSGEQTGLPSACVNWVLMGSSFHWVDKARALPEFHRILKPGGFFTALWNPRDLERSELHTRIEARIKEVVPGLKRVSSGATQYTLTMYEDLTSQGYFQDVVFIEAQHELRMTPERYLGAWRSVNDIQVQAGPEGFKRVLNAIEREISGLDEVVVPYRTRSYTAQRV